MVAIVESAGRLWNYCGYRSNSTGYHRNTRTAPAVPRTPERVTVLMDILIAIVIVAIAAALGLTVHPLLWLIIIVALIWLFTRRASWSR